MWVVDDVDGVWQFDHGGRRRVRVGTQPQDVAATSDGVWVADYGDGTVVRVDAARRRVTERIRLHRRPVAVAAGGRLVAVATLGLPT